ncbi:hypothetical protein BH24ACT3_BH24ACT3_04810 [soil metagenome]
MATDLTYDLADGRTAHIRFTGTAEGDLAIGSGPGLGHRRAAVAPGPWTWLSQVHGAWGGDGGQPRRSCR